jgi:steroid delta-isomerase-like uncharacterized protein
MSPREVVERWVEAWNARDAEAAAALYHDDAVNDQVALADPRSSRTVILEDTREFFAAFPDSYTNPVNLFEEGQWAILEWIGGATWTGPFAGHEPSGKSFVLRGCGFFHVVDGKIKFQRGYWDRATWFGQLGIDGPKSTPMSPEP